MEFYDGASLVGSSTAAPYQVAWTDPSQGVHSLTARAVDSINAVTTSASVPVTIAPAGATAGTLAEPLASPPGGVFGPGLGVALSAAPGATMHYTMDGSDPDATSPIYSAPIVIGQTATIRARAYQAGWTESGIAAATFTVDTAPPVIQATIFPKPNPAGWNNRPVTITFSCVDQSIVANCPAPVTLTQDGAGQLVSVTASDALGLEGTLSLTVNIDSVPPVVALTAPTADLSTSAATVALSADTTDVGAGLAGVMCFGQPTTPAGGTTNCTVPLAPGQNTVVVSATDKAGNSASAGLHVTRLVAATGLQMSPSTLALAVGDTFVLSVNTTIDLPATGVSWTSSNPSVLSVAPENDGTVTAEALGQATVTATMGSLTTQAQVSVLPGAVALGEAIWTVAPTPGRYVEGPIVKANPARDDDPDMFSVEFDPASSTRTVKAVRGADGSTLWSETVGDRPWPDAFGGFLVKVAGAPTAVPNVSATNLRRVGGGGVAPWEYASPLAIDSVAAAPDGTVYLTEFAWADAIPPSPRFPDGGYGYAGFIVVLDGRTGTVRARVPLPTSSWRFRDRLPFPVEGCPSIDQTITEGGVFGPIAVMENGDASVQLQERHLRWDTACPGETTGTAFDSFTLHVWRINAAGEASSVQLASWSNTWPAEPDGSHSSVGQEYFAPGLNRPDGRGGVLSTWYRSAYYGDPGIEEYHATTVGHSGIAADRLAPWAQYDDPNGSNVMVTSDGVIYVPGGPNGEMSAVSTDSWTTLWSGPSSIALVEGMNGGGLRSLTWTGSSAVLEERDATGAVLAQHATDLVSAVVALRDQGRLHGVDSTGALAMISVSARAATEWSQVGGAISACTPGVLNADVSTTMHKGLEIRTAPYTYRFQDFPALDQNGNPNPRHWLLDQLLGVVDAFDTWNTTSSANQLGTMFRRMSTEEQATGVPADIVVWKGGTAVPPGTPGAFSANEPYLPNRRATGGAMFFSASPNDLYTRIGFFKTGLHEIGHTLGLAHPTATPQQPDGNPTFKSSIPGGTVMNPNGGDPPPAPVHKRRDDYRGLVALFPNACDIKAAKDAATR